MFLGPGIVLGVAALLAVVVAQLPEGGGAQAQPASDGFAYATATPTPTPPFTNIQSSVDATTDAGESLRGGIASTVWYQFAPSGDTIVAANTLSSEYNGGPAIHTGPRGGSPSPADRNDRAFGVQPRVIFEATGGSADDFQAGSSFGDAGDPSSNLADGASLGSISGTVTDEGTGLPLSDIQVEVYNMSYSQWGSDYTDSLGNYSVSGLAGGYYKVRFEDTEPQPPPTPIPTPRAAATGATPRGPTSRPAGTYAFEWYDDKGTFDSADPVLVTAGSDRSGINAALALGGSISGTVTGEDTGAPLSDICVSVFDASWDWLGYYGYYGYTDSSGKYSVKGLPTGDYKLSFGDCSSRDPGYAREWYNDQQDTLAADPVPVTAGFETAGINAALAPGGSISGTVTEESTAALSGICVTAHDIPHHWGVGVHTGSSGTYKVKGLPAGDYKVEFEDCDSPALHISEWYDNKEDSRSADPVHVTAGSETTDIDAALAVGGSISGTVTGEDTGAGLPDICVDVYDYDTSWDWMGDDRTDSSGNYSVGGLPTGDYKVEFWDCASPALHLSEWYNDKEDFDSADPVHVTAGSVTGGIDAALVVGGSISGTVTDDATGDPLSDICLYVRDTSWHWMGGGRTDSSGTYSVGGLPSGDYKVEFRDCSSAVRYVSEWYNDKADFDSADPVHVTAGSVTAEIDAALAVGGSISGTVTDEDTAAGISDICVYVFDASHDWAGSGYTDSSGDYRVGGLPSGDYKVEFYDCGSPVRYVSEWYNNKADSDSADPVHVTAGSDRGGTNAALAVGGSISGTVTDEDTGVPLPDICVCVYHTSGYWAGCGRTDSAGMYCVGGLASGDYKVEFYDCSSAVRYVSEWYNDKPDYDSADLVTVTLGSETTGIDAALAVGGSISGTVTDDATADPLSNICVNVYDASHNGAGYGYTDSSGEYKVGGLPSGDYKVAFVDCSSPVRYLSEWYNDKPDFDSADLVHVIAGSVTAPVDAALAVGGSISGTVTGEDTGAGLPDICVNVYDYDTSWHWMGSGYTDSSGKYSVGRLPSGEYKVEFWDCSSRDPGYPSEWYDDKPDFDRADLVHVTVGSVTTGINAALGVHNDAAPISSVAVGTDAYAFGRDAGGSYWNRHWNGTSWEAWSGLGGILSTSPSAVAAGGDVYVFGLDAGGGLWYQRRSGGSWGGWQALGGILSGQVSGVATASNDVYVFGRDASGGYWYRHWNGTSWEDWSGLGGILSTSPSAVAAGGDVYVFGPDAGGGLWYRRFSGGSWGGWQALGGVLAGKPSAAAPGSNDVYVFGLGGDSGLWYRHRDAVSFGPWQGLGGILAD